jgi:hypothetical protein
MVLHIDMGRHCRNKNGVVMKVLVATSLTQGDRPGDFHWGVDGELVWISFVCDTDLNDPDGGCGCGRAFAGMSSHRAMTTAQVVDDPIMTRPEFTIALRSSLQEQGWDTLDAQAMADWLLGLAEALPTGTVIGRRLDNLVIRGQVAAPTRESH